MPAPAHPSKAPEVSAAEIQNRKDFLDQIQQYFHQNNVSVTVEDAINQVALERPTDCYGAMVPIIFLFNLTSEISYFSSRAKCSAGKARTPSLRMSNSNHQWIRRERPPCL